MPHHTVPGPRQPPRTDEQVKPTLLFPLQEPSQSLECPALPCPPRDHHFISTNTVTTHLIPTAFPCVSPFVPLPPVPEHESKDECGARGEQYASEFIAQRTQHAPDKSESRVESLRQRGYTDRLGAPTVLHANGPHKEVICGLSSKLCVDSAVEPLTCLDSVPKTESSPQPLARSSGRDPVHADPCAPSELGSVLESLRTIPCLRPNTQTRRPATSISRSIASRRPLDMGH